MFVKLHKYEFELTKRIPVNVTVVYENCYCLEQSILDFTTHDYYFSLIAACFCEMADMTVGIVSNQKDNDN